MSFGNNIQKENNIIVLITSLVDNTKIQINIPPDDFSESYSPNFELTTLPGRTGSYAVYQGTDSPSLSFSLTVTEDWVEGGNFPQFLDNIRALNFPNYEGLSIIEPKVYIKLGKVFSGVVIMDSISINQKPPIIDESYTVADISFSFKPLFLSSPSASDIKSGNFTRNGS